MMIFRLHSKDLLETFQCARALLQRQKIHYSVPRCLYKRQSLVKCQSLVLCPKRLLGTSKLKHNAESEIPKNEADYRLVYEGPLSKKIRLLKLFSLSTATVSIICAPMFIFFGKQSIPFAAKAVMGGTILVMGVTTTLVMHWLTRVYVHKMYFNANERYFLAETVSIFGNYKKHYFHAGDVCIPDIENAFSTFEAKGNKFFIHVDLKEAEQIMKYIKDYNYEQL